MLRINHAILHVFDFTSCVNVLSQEELDLSGRQTRSFVRSHVRKAKAGVDNMHGSFSPDSGFATEMSRYFEGGDDFVGLSTRVAGFLAGELSKAEKPESTDLLVVDFEEEATDAVGELGSEEEAEAAYEGHGRRYLALLLLASRQAFMHEVVDDGRDVRNEISRHYAILPNPSQKVASYAVIEEGTLDVAFRDKERTIAGERTMLIPDGLLRCSKEASAKEVIDTMTDIVRDVAEEFDAGPATVAVALSRAKACIAEDAEDDDAVSPRHVAEEVFAGSDAMRAKFEEAVVEREIPQRVAVERTAAARMTRSHKIRTDTGIEVTFPSEYSGNSEFIEFVNEPNGLISIELRNIGRIENR